MARFHGNPFFSTVDQIEKKLESGCHIANITCGENSPTRMQTEPQQNACPTTKHMIVPWTHVQQDKIDVLMYTFSG